MQPLRILDMPPCRMVMSPVGMFGGEALEAFGAWLPTALPQTMPSASWGASSPRSISVSAGL